MALGKQVKKYRQARGWTLEQLEAASGVATGTIHALENRDSGRSNYAQALADAFGLTLAQLLDESTQHQVAEPGGRYAGGMAAARAAAAPRGPPGAPCPPGAVSLQQAIQVVAYHMNGLDPPLQAAVGALLAGVCASPGNAELAGRQIAALLSISGNEQAQTYTSSRAG